MGRRLEILLVEDSEADAELVMRALARGGFAPEHRRVEDAESMRAALAEKPWGVILADYALPRFDALAALAVLHESGLDLPFIIVSGSVGEETAVAAMKAGAHDFFLKDRLGRLASAIEREMREAAIRRERSEALARLQESERRLREAVEVRDEFLSIASHELRTPLTPLTLHVESARKSLNAAVAAGAPPEIAPLAHKLEKAGRCITRLSLLVGNLLDVTRINAGREPLERESVDLAEVVDDVVARLREGTNVRPPVVKIAKDEGVIGSWHPGSIESLVTNLVSNAFKFGGDAPVEITMRKIDGAVELSVVDHGLGIEEEAQARIFERFERAVPSKHYGGFGVGLWIARTAVDAHGGTIRVFSEKGKGSRFVVTLPIEPPSEAPRSPRS